MRTECAAIQMSDQMVCMQCQLSWDMNDIDIPVCQAKGGGEEIVNRASAKNVLTRDMALRDHFAAVVLSGLEAGFVSHVDHMSFEEIAEYCYKMADAMIKQRLK